MEFHLKLQALRKERGITQEELAEAIFVSRTAISKWESGKGYPSIDSLKELSGFFSISIDDMLSGDTLITIAEKENKANLSRAYYLPFALVDLFHMAMIFLPLYPMAVGEHVYSVSLSVYGDLVAHEVGIYWVLFAALIVIGLIEVGLAKWCKNKSPVAVTYISIGLSIITVLFLMISREVYATVLVFSLLIIKGILLLKSIKTLAQS